MDCRKFHRDLEDYLEGGLDFAGRFALERHAAHCIACGRELANAERLGQLSRELARVQAPPDFEARIRQEIAQQRSSFLRLPLIFAWDWRTWRNLGLAGSLAAAFTLGIVYRPWPKTPVPPPVPAIASSPPSRPAPAAAPLPAVPAPREPQTQALAVEPSDPEYMEYEVMGPDDRPVTVRLPRRIRMQYGQPSEDYFIRNVSH